MVMYFYLYLNAFMNSSSFGPRQLSNYHIITKTIAGIFGGVSGTIIMVITLMLASNLFQQQGSTVVEVSKNAPAIAKAEINVFILMAGAFLSALSANIIALLGFSLFDREKYTRLMVSIVQIVIINILLFAFITPAYLVISSSKLSSVGFLVGIHIMLANLLSLFVTEVINNQRYALIGFYGNTFGILMALGIILLLALLPRENDQLIGILVLTILPISLAAVGFFSSMFEMFYGWLAHVYTMDPLGNLTSDQELSQEETK